MKCAALNVTDCERPVVVLIARGYRTKEIARALGRSEKQVSAAKRRVFDRNGITNEGQLGMLIERCQFVSTDERNRIEDRREERMDAQRQGVQ